jgi:hypothetical protein
MSVSPVRHPGHWVAPLVAAVLVLVASIATAAPAGADVTRITTSKQITFNDVNGPSVTCVVYLSLSRDSAAKSLQVSGLSDRVSGDDSMYCTGPYVQYDLTVTFEDDSDDVETAHTTGSDRVNLGLDHVSSSIHATLTAHFSLCNPNFSTCSVTVTAAPK